MKKFILLCSISVLFLSAIVIDKTLDNKEQPKFGVIDDSFTVNSLGSYNHTIPLNIAPGVNKLIPNLALTYNSSGGFSELGMGWNLAGLSKISRSGNNFAQHGKSQGITFTNQDAFLLDGQYLTCVKGKNAFSSSEYRTESESFAKVFASDENLKDSDASPKYFTVKYPNGLTYFYGYDENETNPNSRLVVQLSVDKKEIMEWNLNKIVDVNGNYIKFKYDQNKNNVRIASISYTGNYNLEKKPTNKITFSYNKEWGAKRKINESYIAGVSFTNRNTLESIQIETDGDDPYKYYHFTYDESYSKLIKVSESTDEENKNHLRPSIINYYEIDTLSFEKKRIDSIPYLNTSNKPYKQTILDINQDGIKENIVIRNTKDSLVFEVYSKTNTGFDSLSKTLPLQNKYTQNNEFDRITGFLDFNGDGFFDFYTSSGIWVYNTKSENELDFIKYEGLKLPELTGKDGIIYVNDFNGDGKDELIILNKNANNYKEHHIIKLNNENEVSVEKIENFKGGYSKVNFVSFRQSESRDLVLIDGKNTPHHLNYKNGSYYYLPFELPSLSALSASFNNNQIHFQDINLDGLDDILLISDKSSIVPISLNKGSISGKPNFVKYQNLNISPSKINTNIDFGNYLGSGQLELFLPSGSKEFEIYSFSVNNSIVSKNKEDVSKLKIPLPDNFDLTTSNNYRFQDLNGDGITDFLIDAPNTVAQNSIRTNYINSEKFNNRISSVIDGFNNSVKVIYANIEDTSIYTCSNSPLAPNYKYFNYPFTVVKELYYSNGLKLKKDHSDWRESKFSKHNDSEFFQKDSLNSTKYFYKDLILENTGRGLSGFREVSSKQSQDRHLKQVQYEYEFPLSGRIKEEKRLTESGVVFFNQKNEWDVKLYKKSIDFIELETSITSSSFTSTKSFSKNKLNRFSNDILKNLIGDNGYKQFDLNIRTNAPISKAKIAKGITKLNSTGVRYLPILKETSVIKKELDNKVKSKSNIIFNYDRFGNIIRKETRIGNEIINYSVSSYIQVDKPNLPASIYKLGLIKNQVNYVEDQLSKKRSNKKNTSYEYYENGLTKIKTREKGNLEFELNTKFEYDDFGNIITKETFQNNNKKIIERYKFSKDGRFLLSFTNPKEHQTFYAYDHKYGNIISKKDSNDNEFKYEFDDFGNLKKTIFPDGQTSTLKYNFTDQTDDFFRNESNALYKIKSSSTSSSDIINYYDKTGRNVASIFKQIDTTKYRYNTKLDSVFNPLTLNSSIIVNKEIPIKGYVERVYFKKQTYDESGNLKFDFLPKEVRITYTENGNIDCMNYTDDTFFYSELIYDDFNRIVKNLSPDGTENKVDFEVNKKIETNSSGQSITTHYNDRQEITKIIDNSKNTTTYQYNLWGNLTKIVDPIENEIITKYDSIGRKIEFIDNNIGTIKYEYDEFDRQTKEITISNNDKKEVNLKFDKLSRIVEKNESNRKINWYYDSLYKGKIDSIITTEENTRVSKEHFTYDLQGKVLSNSITIGKSTYTTSFEYDEFSRLEKKKYPTGYTLKYLYQNNILTGVKDKEGKIFSVDDLNSRGQITKKSFGNGLVTKNYFNQTNGLLNRIHTYSQNPRADERLVIEPCPKQIENPGNIPNDLLRRGGLYIPDFPRLPSNPFPIPSDNPFDPKNPYGPLGPYGPTNSKDQYALFFTKKTERRQFYKNLEKADKRIEVDIQDISYSYDKNYNLSQKINHISKQGETYKYDNLNRLNIYSEYEENNPSKTTVKITYDDLGNITSKSDIGSYNYNSGLSSHRLTSVVNSDSEFRHKFTYDEYGNITKDEIEGLQIDYTDFNKPSKITKGDNRQVNLYGSMNQQIISKTYKNDSIQRSTIKPFIDFEIIKENGHMTMLHYVMLNGQLVAIHNETKRGSEISKSNTYIHKDHLGSTNVITDENSIVLTEFKYDPFGKRSLVKGLNSTSLKGFTGHEHIAIFDLIDTKGRYYNPSLGRFLSPDPFIQAPNNLQSLNRYSYVLNNPLNIVDPSGYWGIKIKIRNPFKSVARAVRNIGRAIGKAVNDVADVVIKAHKDVYNEADRFVNKYGKQILIVAAAAAITYFSGGTMSQFGLAMLNGAYWGAGIGATMTAANGGDFNDIINAGFNGGINGAAAGAMMYAGSGLSSKFTYGKQVLGGANGYISTGDEDGFYKGILSSFIPADLGMEATESNAWALQLGSSAARGYVIDGERGMKNQVIGNAATQAIGHGVGYFSSGGNGPAGFKNGVYLYKSNYSGSVSIGGVGTIGSHAWSGNSTIINMGLVDHEILHFTQQNTLGANYLTVHIPFALINAASGGEYAPLERGGFHPEPEKGGYSKH